MRRITESNKRISTILAFTLIPLSGLVTDIYLPSLPDMALYFNTNSAGIQQTLILFLISYGIAQFFAGSILDSFGRYLFNLISLFIFTISCFIIIHTHNLHLVYFLRIIQGIATAFIVVGKRALFVDVYTGEKQKHYTSLLTIVWAAAPITAPFIGGFLQKNFGWTSNFYLLGFYGLGMFIMEALFSGESLPKAHPFKAKSIFSVYKKMISTFHFSSGVLILGISYSMVMVFSMSIPFLVEHKFHMSAVITGYCSLLSGLSMFFGGIIGKLWKKDTIGRKSSMANMTQIAFILIMLLSAGLLVNLSFLMAFVIVIHIMVGLIYNLFFTYCLTRFPENAGVASGVTSGGSYIITSLFSTFIISLIIVNDQHSLALCYLILALLVSVLIVSIKFLTTGKLQLKRVN